MFYCVEDAKENAGLRSERKEGWGGSKDGKIVCNTARRLDPEKRRFRVKIVILLA